MGAHLSAESRRLAETEYPGPSRRAGERHPEVRLYWLWNFNKYEASGNVDGRAL
jgi:hypothetical protein